MFLTESNTGVTNETSMYEAIMEASNEYHALCMKMVKCEHHAIVSENYQLLEDAEEGFFDKVKRIAKVLYQKFISFLNRIKAEWSKLVAWVATKFAKEEDVRKIVNNTKDFKVKVKVKEGILYKNVFDIYLTCSKSSSENNIQDVIDRLKAFDDKIGGQSRSEQTVKRADVIGALTFLQRRKDFVKALESMRSEGGKAYKLSEQQKNEKQEDLLIAKYSTVVNKVIARVNFLTIDAMKICRAVLSTKNFTD